MEVQNKRPVILIICDYYLPGYESGGAMRTIVNMVDRLGNEYDFRIIARDHDGPLDRTPYPNVRINAWNEVGNARAYYLSKDQIRPSTISRLIRETSPDAVYLNSFLSSLTVFVLVLHKLRRVGPIPIVLAPEGEFSPGALSLKPLKKQLYIKAAKLLGILHNVVWKAASESELVDIERSLGKNRKILIAPNMPPKMIFPEYDRSQRPQKMTGQVKMVFLSRFMRKKNLNWLLGHLSQISGDLSIDVCGPLEEQDYWEETQRLVATLPKTVTITSKGPVPHDQVSNTIANYHFFVLPTLGENFGHVFIEALASGCPIITSDRTPWRDLEDKGIGWDLPLEEPAAWVAVVNKCLSMNNDDYRIMSQRSREFAVEWLANPTLEASNIKVLESAVRQSPRDLGRSYSRPDETPRLHH